MLRIHLASYRSDGAGARGVCIAQVCVEQELSMYPRYHFLSTQGEKRTKFDNTVYEPLAM